jgi:hypothetical protein
MTERGCTHLTAWPGTPVDVPPHPVPEVRLVEGDTLVFGVPPNPRDIRMVTLRPDFYLREFRDFDASDAQQVLAFCREWGPVGGRDCDDLHVHARPTAQEADAAMAEPWRRLLVDLWPGRDRRSNIELGKRLGFGLEGMILQVHSVGRVALYQAALSNAVELWRLISGESTPEELIGNWRADDVGLGTTWSRRQLYGEASPLSRVSDTQSEAIFDLTQHLNPALVPFHVRLEPYVFGSDVKFNVYQAASLQLTNDIAAKVTYGRCANEKCGRLFSRQRDRAESTQHRMKGVRYCSVACARAQAQRALRRRKRQP